MKYNNREIDHIVYAVHDLDKAIDQIENQLGVRPKIGGRHLNKGTKNALLNLGNSCYLEILSIDADNKKITKPRWMGVDLIEKEEVTRWALKSNILSRDQKILQAYKPELGERFQGERLTTNGNILKWEMTLPRAQPRIELAPFMVDWSKSDQHPTENLQNECSLLEINFKAPRNNLKIRSLFIDFFDTSEIKESTEEEISIIIKGPKGLLNL